MTARRNATFEDLLAAVDSLAEQAKLLVSAVVDLRDETQRQAGNIAAVELPLALAPASPISNDREQEEGKLVPQSPAAEDVDGSLIAAAGRLRACERELCEGPRGVWLDEWFYDEDFEMPWGHVIPVNSETWHNLLNIRFAHVIGEGCCCEDAMGWPYLLAWQSGAEFLLRELTIEEADRLRELCRAHQMEQAARGVKQTRYVRQFGMF